LKKISSRAETLYVLPLEQRLEDKLILPLRQAYASHLLGNYLGTLALCGMIGEMLTIFKFEISNIKLARRKLSKDDEKSLFGYEFERLGQERRIEVLTVYKLIDKDSAKLLGKIRKIRNNYLHYWSRDHDQLENDSFQVLCATIDFVKNSFPQHFENGKVVLSPEVTQYLQQSTKI
jgi:hypothetical protein